MLFRGKYSGSSFFELLELDYPQLRVSLSELAAKAAGEPSIPHGTTVLAFKYRDGVLVAGDRLATEGMRVASRDIEKVYPADEHSLVAIAGAAGPAIEIARLLRIELEHYEKIEGEALELEGKANKLSQMIRANLPAAMQGLVVVPLFAGFDRQRKTGRLWKYDVTGGRYEEADFDATGSGGLFAKDSLKNHYRSDLTRDAAVGVAVGALADAADEDRATGGIDLEREIYPIVKTCSDDGIEDIPESELGDAYRARLQERRNRN